MITRASGVASAAEWPTAKRSLGRRRRERQPLAVRRDREAADAVRQRRQLLGVAARERHRPDLPVAQEAHAIVVRRNCGEESRTSPAVSARARPPSSGTTQTCRR